jgi:hypothetical protein
MQTDFQPASSALAFVLFRKTVHTLFLQSLFRVEILDEQQTILGGMRKGSRHIYCRDFIE